MQKASEVNYRDATLEEDNIVLNMDDEEFVNFLDEAEVVHENGDLLAVVDGVAYHIEELAKRRGS